MKNLLLLCLQLILFLVVFAAGSLFPFFHLQYVLTSTVTATRVFIADGLVLALAIYLLILLAELLTKRLRSAGTWTTLAFLLAIGTGFFLKFGFLTRSAL